MAPPSSPARAFPSRPHGHPDASGSRRPPLRLFEPGKRKERGRRPGQTTHSPRRSTMWLSGVIVVGSLLAVVLGDSLVSEGQVRLAAVQQQLQSATRIEKNYQVDVAKKSAPDLLVTEAEAQGGLIAPPNVGYLPYVPLDVPLPVPQTAPLPGQAPPAGTSATASNTSPTAGQ